MDSIKSSPGPSFSPCKQRIRTGTECRKPFTCRIVINTGLIGQPVRWRTLIHEALHSFSAGYNSADYQKWRGWEEGVVEQLQRLLRPLVLDRFGVVVDEDVFAQVESEHAFNPFMAALERLRTALGAEDPRIFYVGLLGTPIKDRPGFIFGRGNKLPAPQRIQFVKMFSAANAALKERSR